ncbi:decapping and exoribonuclease protein-like [Lepeophtheirus salmonis]|uniref:decapping and exoribonuclease protein-like n=1 Tax=Lepeophtheirus salmonis TaxID=72036 RepID=UPI001AE242ED|nr:decapping and exoribonuclease protein-like [Lepeophtheirus salmonis]
MWQYLLVSRYIVASPYRPKTSLLSLGFGVVDLSGKRVPLTGYVFTIKLTIRCIFYVCIYTFTLTGTWWIHSHPQVLPADFVLSRGILAKMMRTPYEKYEPWYFSVVKHRNTFYFKQNETDYERRKETTIRNFYSKYFHWGNQFDYHLTKRITPDINNVLNVCQEYCGVYRRKVNDLCLLYNAEIDGVMMNHENNDPHRPEDFVEFKLTLAIQNERHFEKVAQRKFIRWWAQSFLVGIPRIVCGFRDYDGLVHEIKEYLTEEIPSSRGVTWKSSVCCNFLKDILSSLKNRSDLSSDVVYCISWTPPGMTINIKETEDSLESILPLWYTN